MEPVVSLTYACFLEAAGVALGATHVPFNTLQVHSIITSPARRCLSTAQLISQLQVEVSRQGAAVPAASDTSKPPRVLVLPELRNLDVGMWEGQPTKLVSMRTHDHHCMQSIAGNKQQALCSCFKQVSRTLLPLQLVKKHVMLLQVAVCHGVSVVADGTADAARQTFVSLRSSLPYLLITTCLHCQPSTKPPFSGMPTGCLSWWASRCCCCRLHRHAKTSVQQGHESVTSVLCNVCRSLIVVAFRLLLLLLPPPLLVLHCHRISQDLQMDWKTWASSGAEHVSEHSIQLIKR